MQSLSELLLADGVCTAQQIEEAVRNQVILGGKLGTNLIEFDVLDEATLARYLARLHGVPALAGDQIVPDPRALAMLRPDLADRLNLIPFRREPKRIQVLCLDPGDLNALDELAFTTSLHPVPIVVPEIRFWQLLKQCYGIERQLRYIALDSHDYLADIFSKGSQAPAPQPSVQEDLTSEESFARLYHRRDGFPETRVTQPPPSETMPVLADADLEIVEEVPEPHPPGSIERRVWQAEGLATGRRQEDEAEPAPAQDIQPLTFQQASTQLAQATDRDAIALLVLRYARSLFKRAMLFTIHRGVALGWDAIGEDIDRSHFPSVMVPLGLPSVFQLVVESRAHSLGRLTKTEINIRFLKVMGKKVPLSSFLLPVLSRGRVVNILYADNGHKSHCSVEIGELLILAQKIAGCYESLYQQKIKSYKARGQSGQ